MREKDRELARRRRRRKKAKKLRARQGAQTKEQSGNVKKQTKKEKPFEEKEQAP